MRSEQSSRKNRQVFAFVFGIVLILWGLAAGYHELSLVRAQNASRALDVITDIEDHRPAYPGLVFLGGVALVVFVACSATARLVRYRWTRSR